MERCGNFNTGEEVFVKVNGEYVLGKYLGLEEVEKDGRFYLAELYELVDGRLWDIIVEW
jgi:hypothetical protein